MQKDFESRLHQLNIVLPVTSTPAANYIPYVQSGALLFISGQLPRIDGKLVNIGKLGAELTVADGQKAARACALNLIAQLRAACGGDLGRVQRCVRLTGFVNSTPDFYDHPQVINGASDLMTEVFGESGKHARTALGVAALPANAPVEVEAIFEIRD